MHSAHAFWIVLVLAAFGCSAAPEEVPDEDSGPRIDTGRRDARMDTGPGFDIQRRDIPPIETAPGPPPVQRFGCMGCPDFPERTVPACAGGDAALPQIIYPPEGVLLPPNLNVIEVQFSPGMGNTLFEVGFTNAFTDVRVTTHCAPITSVRGTMTGACGFTLPQPVWDALVAVNRGREPVTITIRGAPEPSTCIATSMVARHIRFAWEDIAGGIYYWQSAIFGGAAGRTGGIYLHDFGTRETRDIGYLESGTSGRCTGCHNLSRDGERISIGLDDPDADDEFWDVTTQMLRVSDKRVLRTGIRPGFQTFSSDHHWMLTSNFASTSGDRSFMLFDSSPETTSTVAARTIMLPGTMQGTQPDWSADDRHVVFVVPRMGSIASQGDHHFHGGDLYVIPVDTMMNFGVPSLLLPANLRAEVPETEPGNYYPSYSPDGNFIIFNHTPSRCIFYNQGAQVYLTTADGRSVSPLHNLNGGATATNLTNSWPRWSPFVQTYGTGHILWVTFSSNRDYGVRVTNDPTRFRNCFPTASPTEDQPQSTAWAMCQQPQIWMAAVGVDTDEFGTGRDTSWPAFWLPFQNIASHNHSAQWVARVIDHRCVPEGGTCPGPGGTDCCTGFMCDPTTHTCVRRCIPEHGTCPGPAGETCCDGVPCDPATHTCERAPG